MPCSPANTHLNVSWRYRPLRRASIDQGPNYFRANVQQGPPMFSVRAPLSFFLFTSVDFILGCEFSSFFFSASEASTLVTPE